MGSTHLFDSGRWIDQQTSFCDTDFSYIGCAELLHGLENQAAHRFDTP
jgi:hypothetical protein